MRAMKGYDGPYPFMAHITLPLGQHRFFPLHRPHNIPPGPTTLLSPLHSPHSIPHGQPMVRTLSWPPSHSPWANDASYTFMTLITGSDLVLAQGNVMRAMKGKEAALANGGMD